jgi:hypothetical protein
MSGGKRRMSGAEKIYPPLGKVHRPLPLGIRGIKGGLNVKSYLFTLTLALSLKGEGIMVF